MYLQGCCLSCLSRRPGAPPAKPSAGLADHQDATSPVQADPASKIRQLPDRGNISQASSINLRATSSPQLVRSVSTKVLASFRSASTSLRGIGEAAAGSVTAVVKDSVGHGNWKTPELEQHKEMRTAYQQSGTNAAGLASCEWSRIESRRLSSGCHTVEMS